MCRILLSWGYGPKKLPRAFEKRQQTICRQPIRQGRSRVSQSIGARPQWKSGPFQSWQRVALSGQGPGSHGPICDGRKT